MGVEASHDRIYVAVSALEAKILLLNERVDAILVRIGNETVALHEAQATLETAQAVLASAQEVLEARVRGMRNDLADADTERPPRTTGIRESK